MGLIGGIARTAVIAGTATHVSNNVSRRQANRWAEKDQAAAAAAPAPDYAAPPPVYAAPPPPVYQAPPPVYAAPPPAPAMSNDELFAQLKQLGELKDAGILTEEEFAAKKAQMLGI
jgi:hypothetical protein